MKDLARKLMYDLMLYGQCSVSDDQLKELMNPLDFQFNSFKQNTIEKIIQYCRCLPEERAKEFSKGMLENQSINQEFYDNIILAIENPNLEINVL